MLPSLISAANCRLNSPHFYLIGGDGKDWSISRPAQIGNVFRFTIQDSPAYAGRDCCLGHLDHFGAHRLHDDRIGTLCAILDYLDQLLGLVDGVIVGVKNLDFHAEPGSCLCS